MAGLLGMLKGAKALGSKYSQELGAGALMGMGGIGVYKGLDKMKKRHMTKEYQGLRKLIKEATGGLGGLVYNKDKDEFILTYAGTANNAIKEKHMGHISAYIKAANEKLDIKVSDRVSFMSEKKSKEMNKTIRSSLKTEEGREKLSGFIDRQMSDPYAKDYGGQGKDPFGFGVPR